MNYTIKATSADITIGSTTFTTQPINLVGCKALTDDRLFESVYSAVLTNTVEILMNGVQCSGCERVLSQYIGYVQTGQLSSVNLPELVTDISLWSRTKYSMLTDPIAISIDANYDSRIPAGQQFYRDERALLIKELIDNSISEAELSLIESKIWGVRNALLFGDWYSAYNEIDASIVEGAYTQTRKDAWLTKIGTYVNENYSGITVDIPS